MLERARCCCSVRCCLPASPSAGRLFPRCSLVCCCSWGMAGSPVLVARDGEPCGRQRTVRGDRGGGFVLIGVLTSLWRASGTIAFIVAHSTAVIHAATVIPLSFLLCSAMSVLVGSSFASAATMGTICMSLGLSMQRTR